MAIKHLKADSKIEHILEVLDQDAGLIIDNVVSSDGCLLYTSDAADE